jgi:hypothetical protein
MRLRAYNRSGLKDEVIQRATTSLEPSEQRLAGRLNELIPTYHPDIRTYEVFEGGRSA